MTASGNSTLQGLALSPTTKSFKIAEQAGRGGGVGGAFCPKRRSRFVEEEKMLSAQLTPVNLSALKQSSHYSLFLPSSDEKT